jgi:Fe-S-cluster-containing dehydrogenase component
MKKCTLCVDRIYNDNLPEEDRVPACVRACPAGARHFGDLGDSTSDISQLVAERGGYDLMPEQGTRPVNKYLPPRGRDAHETAPVNLAELAEPEGADNVGGFLGWLDAALERIG